MTSADLTPQQVYHQVSQAGSFASRAGRGTMSVVREFIISEHLRGTAVVPQVDLGEGLYGYPLSFQMEKINNGGTLQDWLEFHSLSPIPRLVREEIFQGLSEGIRAAAGSGPTSSISVWP